MVWITIAMVSLMAWMRRRPATIMMFVRNLRVMGTRVFLSGQARVKLSSTLEGAYTLRTDSSGKEQWQVSHWLPTQKDSRWTSTWALAPALNGGHYSAGYGKLKHGKNFGYIARYTDKGTTTWVKQFASATGAFNLTGMASNAAGDVFVTGSVGYDLDGAAGAEQALGGMDAYLQKWSQDGKLIWTRQFGTGATEWGRKVVVYPDGSIWVLGATTGSMDGSQFGGRDIFVRHYDAAGKLLAGTLQFGSGAVDFGYNMDVDSKGNLVVIGGMGTNGIQLVKIDKTGKKVWHKKWTVSGMVMSAQVVRVVAGDEIVIAGVTNKTFLGLKHPTKALYGLFVLRFDSKGEVFK